MPDLKSLPKVFDRPLIARHLARRPKDADDFVTRLVLADLDERLGTVTRNFQQALIMSPDASILPTAGRSANAPFRFERASTVVTTPGIPLVDPEVLDLPQRGYDLIVSLFDLDVVDDVPGFLARARAHLRGDGLFIAAAITPAAIDYDIGQIKTVWRTIGIELISHGQTGAAEWAALEAAVEAAAGAAATGGAIP